MFNSRTGLTVLAVSALLWVLSSGARADVVTPALDISTAFGGSGVSNVGGNLTIEATVFSIFLEGTPLPPPIDIPDETFTLTATYSGSSGSSYTFVNGTVTAGSYMTATFTSMTLFSLGGGDGVLLETPLTYTGGTLIGGFTGGSMLGQITGATSADFSTDFTATGPQAFSAKAGPVVPVPAAVWLFGSGLLGLVAVARRKKSSI